MINMRAVANSHQYRTRIPAAASVCGCVRVPPTPVTRKRSQFSLAPRNFSARYVGKSDSESVLVRMEVMWDGGSDFGSLL